MPMFVWPLAALFAASAAYVRTAPTKADLWHQPIATQGPGDHKTAGSFTHIRDGMHREDFDRLVQIILNTPRTHQFAGSPGEGFVTFETRSKVMGFPDYTTVQFEPDTGQLSIFGRLRFGKGDMGVNEKRIKGWLGELDGDKAAA